MALFLDVHLAVFGGRHAELVLDIFSEEGDVGETQSEGNFLDAEVCVAQLADYVLYDKLVNPTGGCASRELFANGAEILRRDA